MAGKGGDAGNGSDRRRGVNIVALAGGVGGAKLADGLYRVLPPDTLTIIGNTADDLELFGLHISPDLDTVMYTLAGLANPATGWGVVDDTFTTLGMLERYGEEIWFRLGDADFATHLKRTAGLHAGQRLTDVTASLTEPLGIRARLLPMCDERVGTEVETPEGWRDFQDYFVRRRHEDRVTQVRFAGIEEARITPEVAAALARADAIIFCPSNPLVSIGPILAVPGLRDALVASAAVKIAVSPIVGGKALKGPADRMLAERGMEVSAYGVATGYVGLLDAMTIDALDAPDAPRIEALGMAAQVVQTVMRSDADREQLARDVLAFAASLGTWQPVA
ncbi:MAG: 2-phospho-L-lactate transferase [Chloroflexota bacterium]|nr:2-phospho-L-lactate transferase [Chloroflexota bacterium]